MLPFKIVKLMMILLIKLHKNYIKGQPFFMTDPKFSNNDHFYRNCSDT